MDDPVEAVAEAWASIDGNLDQFRLCRDREDLEETLGSHGGYREDAKALIERTLSRGWKLVRVVQ